MPVSARPIYRSGRRDHRGGVLMVTIRGCATCDYEHMNPTSKPHKTAGWAALVCLFWALIASGMVHPAVGGLLFVACLVLVVVAITLKVSDKTKAPERGAQVPGPMPPGFTPPGYPPRAN